MSDAPETPKTPGTRATGGCLCGGVRYRVTGPLRPVVGCHCEMCRRTSGHHVAATACLSEHLVLESAGTLTWYRSSPSARRGFCGTCGGNLFWSPDSGTHVSIMAGTLDMPSGLSLVGHIHVAGKGDYFELDPALPAFEGDEPESSGWLKEGWK
ncbi:GFA family protein [uncultured Albimonas sp.]|uniref:GFA family protein n=1 Tax=uncultured Albimonas sp. TaxID=1331701 RepID=UPI0030EF9F06